MNVDFYQREMNRHYRENHHMPILFFTQLMGLAFGMPAERLGFGREIISSREALGNIGITVPAPVADGEVEPVTAGAAGTPARRRRGDPTLPSPAAREDEEALR
jgi:heterodisulfide reductase subunit B